MGHFKTPLSWEKMTAAITDLQAMLISWLCNISILMSHRPTKGMQQVMESSGFIISRFVSGHWSSTKGRASARQPYNLEGEFSNDRPLLLSFYLMYTKMILLGNRNTDTMKTNWQVFSWKSKNRNWKEMKEKQN